MNKLFIIISLLTILSGCSMLGAERDTNQQCSFAEEICADNLSALQNGIAKFNAKGGAYIVKDMDSGEILENTSIDFDTNAVYKTYFSKINFANKTTPERLLNKYVNLVQSSGKGLQQKLRENVTAGTARRANLKEVEVYGITATTAKDSNKAVITTFLGHFKHNGKNYAYVFAMDEPKSLKSTYGWQSAGWNVVPTARNIIANIAR